MFLKFGGFNILALPVVRPKYAVHHGRKLTSLVSSPLDLHTCGEIHKHYILKNYSTKDSVCSKGFNIIATRCL